MSKSSKSKEPFFTLRVRKPDFEVEYYRHGGGSGGQKLNKTASACRIKHVPSGVVVACHEHRMRHFNRRDALRKLVETPKFKSWMRVETAARAQGFTNAAAKVDASLKPSNLHVEVFNHDTETD